MIEREKEVEKNIRQVMDENLPRCCDCPIHCDLDAMNEEELDRAKIVTAAFESAKGKLESILTLMVTQYSQDVKDTVEMKLDQILLYEKEKEKLENDTGNGVENRKGEDENERVEKINETVKTDMENDQSQKENEDLIDNLREEIRILRNRIQELENEIQSEQNRFIPESIIEIPDQIDLLDNEEEFVNNIFEKRKWNVDGDDDDDEVYPKKRRKFEDV